MNEPTQNDTKERGAKWRNPTPDEQNDAIAESLGIVSRDQHGKLYRTDEGYVRDCQAFGYLELITTLPHKLCEAYLKARARWK